MVGGRGPNRSQGLGSGDDDERRRRGGRGEKNKGSHSQAGAAVASSTSLENKNYSVLNLDNAATAHYTWRMTVFRYRLWCFNTTDEWFYFGHKERQSCKLPKSGHFLVYVHYHGNWMCLVIDCPTGYLTGYITRSLPKDKKIQENRTEISEGLSKARKKEIRSQLPMYIEDAKMLPWKGSYLYAVECLLGTMGLQNSFKTMYKHLEGMQMFTVDEIRTAREHFIVHIPEAGRSDVLFNKIDTNFIVGVNKMGASLLGDAQNWAGHTDDAFDIMVDTSASKWDRKALKKHGKSTEDESEGVEEKVFGPEVEHQLLIIEDLRAVNENTTSETNKGNESMADENTEYFFDNPNANSPDPQRFTDGCNVSGDVLLPKHEKAEVNNGSPPPISFEIAMENSVTQVNFRTNIIDNAQPTSSQVIIRELDDDNALTDSTVTLKPVSTELNSAVPTPDQEQSEPLALAPNPISNVLGQDSGSSSITISGIGLGQTALLDTAGTNGPQAVPESPGPHNYLGGQTQQPLQ
ncbi:hypothetical protein ZWY2020_005618 [Hordeum vulgare]|nr:hypothetical protein ZWY2020_005618 [Hordeum vulgare]